MQSFKRPRCYFIPRSRKYNEWKNKASEIDLKYEILIEAEHWFEKGLIGKGEAIDEYY
jgi:hypothetical protein